MTIEDTIGRISEIIESVHLDPLTHSLLIQLQVDLAKSNTVTLTFDYANKDAVFDLINSRVLPTGLIESATIQTKDTV